MTKARFVNFNRNCMRPNATPHSLRAELRSQPLFNHVYRGKYTGVNSNAGLNPARQAGRSWKISQFSSVNLAGERSNIRFSETCFYIGMANIVICSSCQTGAVVSQVVDIGTGDDQEFRFFFVSPRTGSFCNKSSGCTGWPCNCRRRTHLQQFP